jgi:hypothetical protein
MSIYKSLVSPHPPINAREKPDVDNGLQKEERKTSHEDRICRLIRVAARKSFP